VEDPAAELFGGDLSPGYGLGAPASLRLRCSPDTKHNLQGGPLGKVQLRRIATFIDPATRRFWVRDERYSPILTDAVVHLLQDDVPMEVQPITAQALVGGQFGSQLVAIDGRLLSVENSLNSKILVVESGGRILNAKVFIDSEQPLPPLEPESVLRLTGICTAQVSADAVYSPLGREALGCNLAIPSPEHVQVLRPAPGWNLRHTLALLVALLVAIIISVACGTQLRQRVQRQNQALERAFENTRAIQDLTLASREVTQHKQFTSKVSVHCASKPSPGTPACPIAGFSGIGCRIL